MSSRSEATGRERDRPSASRVRDPPAPKPATARPPLSSARLAWAAAVCPGCRVKGFVMPGPTSIEEVAKATAAETT